MSLPARIEKVRGWAEALGLPLPADFPVTHDEGACLSVSGIEQGDPLWWLLRTGLPTSSNIGRIVTASRMEYSAQARPYIAELMAEEIIGQPSEWGSTDFTLRGQDMEKEARAWYEIERGVEVRQVAFLIAKDGSEGGSPDGFVGEEGIVEIKCRSAKHHMTCVLGIGPIALPGQVQHLLRLTGRKWCDLVAYNPALPRMIERVYRNQAYIDAIDECMAKFRADRAKAEASLAEIGDVRIVDSELAAQLAASIKPMDSQEIGDALVEFEVAKADGHFTARYVEQLRKAIKREDWAQVRQGWKAAREALGIEAPDPDPAQLEFV